MKKKLLTAVALTLAAVILVVASVLTTIAYLTSAAKVSNTFTVGKVGILMYESQVDDQGKALPDNSSINGDMKDSSGNSYHLVPGATYSKDPTIYVLSKSVPSYLFLYVQNDIAAIEADGYDHDDGDSALPEVEGMKSIHNQLLENGWRVHKVGEKGTAYYYSNNAANEEDLAPRFAVANEVIPTFSTFTVDGHADVDAYEGKEVNVTAYAIQEQEIDTVAAAWDAIVASYPNASVGN